MKEATGELSTTAIAIVAIGLILALFTTIFLPMIKSQIALNQACNSGPGFVGENVCCTNAGQPNGNCTVTGKTSQKGSKTCSGTTGVGNTNTQQYRCIYFE